MNTSEFKTQAAAVHAQLRDELAQLRSKFEEKRGWLMDDAVEGAITSTLRVLDASLAGLSPEGAVTARVISGEKSAQWWDDQARVPRDSIAYVAKSMGESLPSWERIKGEIIEPTAREFVADAQTLTEAAASLLPWWAPWAIGGGLTLGVVILAGVYLPKPGN